MNARRQGFTQGSVASAMLRWSVTVATMEPFTDAVLVALGKVALQTYRRTIKDGGRTLAAPLA